MSTRLKDIAALTGVSPTAVSYVLNGRGGKVAPATREKVLRAADRLGYRPNGAARAVREGRHGAVALIMSPFAHRSLLAPELMSGIHRELSRHNLRLLVDYIADEHLTSETTLPRLLRERACDGMLLNYHAHVPPMLAELTERFRLPTVWLNARQDFNSVYPDDFGAAKLATETLLSEGRRRVAYVDSTYNDAIANGNFHFSKRDRRAGYEAAMQAAGLPVELIFDETAAPSRRENIAAFHAQLLARFQRRRPAPPDAIVCYGGWDLGVLRQIQTQLNLDLAILSFGIGDSALNNQLTRGLIVPLEEIGARAITMLLRRLENSAPIPSEVIPFRWVDASR